MITHDDLLIEYAEALRQAKALAEAWWIAVGGAPPDAGTDAAAATSDVAGRWRAGPSSHPFIIGVLRTFFLRCEALNVTLETQGQDDDLVPPHVFITEWLLDDYEDLAVFIADLPYWPLGLSAHDDWV